MTSFPLHPRLIETNVFERSLQLCTSLQVAIDAGFLCKSRHWFTSKLFLRKSAIDSHPYVFDIKRPLAYILCAFIKPNGHWFISTLSNFLDPKLEMSLVWTNRRGRKRIEPRKEEMKRKGEGLKGLKLRCNVCIA